MTLHSPVPLTCKMKDGQVSPLEYCDLELPCQCGTRDPTEHPPVDSRSRFGASEKELCGAEKKRSPQRVVVFFFFLSFFFQTIQPMSFRAWLLFLCGPGRSPGGTE